MCKKGYPIKAGVPFLLPGEGKYKLQMKIPKNNYKFSRSAIYKRPKNKFQGKLPYHLPAEIASLFKTGQKARLLELGCGRAQNREFFVSRGYRYVGVDIKPNGADVVCDAHFLPFKNCTFEAGITFSTLEHLWNPHLAVSEIYRVLAGNAQFDGEAAFLEAFHDNSYFHLSPFGLEACLQNAGFSVDRIWPGWGVGESLGHYVFNPYQMSIIGRIIGKTFDLLHRFIMIGGNLIRRILGKPTIPITELMLRFAGSIHWIAAKTATGCTTTEEKIII